MESNTLKIDFAHRNKDGSGAPLLVLDNLKVSYGTIEVLHGISMTFQEHRVHSLIGPSGCGKSTLLRSLNRMHEIQGHGRSSGGLTLRGEEIASMEPLQIRKQMGMVFQRPNPFPDRSIRENVLSGFRLCGVKLTKAEEAWIVEDSLRRSALWDEVKDKLKVKGGFLSGGQQQRLCVARALAMDPGVLILDEPTSALDPVSTSRMEDLIMELRDSVTVIMVTHNIQQAARISDMVAFLYLGELIEYDTAEKIFLNPRDERTERYVRGQFG